MDHALTIYHHLQETEIEKRLKNLIIRDLSNLDWNVEEKDNQLIFYPPQGYNKSIIINSMAFKRNAILESSRQWINDHIDLLRKNMATGKQALASPIDVRIEICKTSQQFALFRMCRYYWSSPYSDYVGRRIKFLFRDYAYNNKPIIGIAALGSPIIHIPERDEWIGWDLKTRTKNINFCMDAYIVGSIPPYNQLLGGKLVAYLLVSNGIRKFYQRKYQHTVSIISGKTISDLVCLFTTGLYGKSSQYNRISIDGQILYYPIGMTKGFGSLHLSDETFQCMRKLLTEKNIQIYNRFRAGPNWRMRVIRTACDILGINADILLCHSFKRSIYAIPLAQNFKDVLLSDGIKPNYFDFPKHVMIDYWKRRWLFPRKKFLQENGKVKEIYNFSPDDFEIF